MTAWISDAAYRMLLNSILAFYAVEDRTPWIHPWMNELCSSLRQ